MTQRHPNPDPSRLATIQPGRRSIPLWKYLETHAQMIVVQILPNLRPGHQKLAFGAGLQTPPSAGPEVSRWGQGRTPSVKPLARSGHLATTRSVLPLICRVSRWQKISVRGLLSQVIFRHNSLMAEELWRPSLDLALHRNRQSPLVRFVQLANTRENGRPAVRTLTFRGFLGETHRMTFAIDARSVKAAELEQSPWVEACWYFHLTREQFRFMGPVSLAGPETHDRDLHEARTQVWRELSAESRLTYTWPHPGRPRESLTPFPTLDPDPQTPLPHFRLLVLEIWEVDHLELHGNPQHRWKYSRDSLGRWSGLEINP
jgi:pyridoxamine 5'-phosphate oxidase